MEIFNDDRIDVANAMIEVTQKMVKESKISCHLANRIVDACEQVIEVGYCEVDR